MSWFPGQPSRPLGWDEIAALSPPDRELFEEAARKNVFGENYKTVNGKPVEAGIGAPGHETASSREALRKEKERIDRLRTAAKV
jgi:hypothetical protein